ncbi:sensor histidine kinase [Streptomyces sp. SKN60]|uniref:sensor histidine kinase n=1 Tax=Streptomyces sp. SKN60 TaxID=2855506 RepID=UPI0022478AA4|nr:sensor histidine kinase [Streptomyces sp. SKN60]MCX2182736.1 sensor histidine kinase [Streptomyces sp. SKN60]
MPALQALRPRLAPVALAVGFAVAGCLIGTFYHPAPWRPFGPGAYLLTLLIALPLALREKRAFGVLVVTGTGFAGYLLLGYQPSLNFWCPAVAFVSVCARERRGRVILGTVLLAVVIALSGVYGRLPWPVTVVQALIVPAVAGAVGLTQRRLAQRNAELRRLTLLLDEQQRQEARRAVLDERFRIARELHDTISQHMTIVTLQTGLAQYTFHSDPAAAHQALGIAATAGRETLDDLRRLLVVLRTYDLGGGATSSAQDPSVPADPSAPIPDDLLAGIDRIPALAERLEAAGLRVVVHFSGARRPLHPGIELCAYRVVQEALTNVVKHSGARAAEVTVAYLDQELRVTVLDEGAVDDAPGAFTSALGSGHGLIGMRERAKIWHGSLTAEARPGGGFQVRLRIPLEQNAAPKKDTLQDRDRDRDRDRDSG